MPTPLVRGAAGGSCRQGVVSADPLNADVLVEEPAPQRPRPDASPRRVRRQESERRPDSRTRPPARDRSRLGVADLLVLFADELERRESAPEEQLGDRNQDVNGPASAEPPSETVGATAPARSMRGRPRLEARVLEVIAVGVVNALALTANGIRREVSPSLTERAETLPAFPSPREQVERRAAQPEKTQARKRSARRARTRRARADLAPGRSHKDHQHLRGRLGARRTRRADRAPTPSALRPSALQHVAPRPAAGLPKTSVGCSHAGRRMC